MPKAFEEAVDAGAPVRTVRKGPNKGRLIALRGDHPVLGGKRGHKKKGHRKRPGKRGSARDFERFL